MAYVVPQVRVHQELAVLPAGVAGDMTALILGPHAFLLRYDEPDEKPLGYLGPYDPSRDVSYSWPQKPSGSKIDLGSVDVRLDGARLRYFEDLIGSGETIAPVSNSKNKIQGGAGFYWRTANGYARSASLKKDVEIGDPVWLRATVNGNLVELWTKVLGFEYEKIASSVGTPAADPNNPSTQTASTTVTQVAGTDNGVSLAADASNFNGLKDGYVNDTYYVEVISGSTGGDLTTAVLRVTTQSGLDDVDAISPAASGTAFSVGTKGLELTFTTTGDDLVPGQKWQVSVTGPYTAPDLAAGGTYTGSRDTTYIVKVTRGGKFTDAQKPQVTVTTAHGIDVSGPTDVTALDQAISVGTYGVTLTFSDPGGGTLEGLRYGDVFTIPVTAEKNAGAKVLVLQDELGDLTQASDLDCRIYIEKDIQVSRQRWGHAPEVNWVASDTELVLKAGILATDPAVLDANGNAVDLPVDYGKVYVGYRAWRSDLANDIYDISDVSQLDELVSGPLTPDNPLKWGLYAALTNAGGATILFSAVADPDDLNSWSNALDLASTRDDVYNIVPLTFDSGVQSLVMAHVNDHSSAVRGQWRAMVAAVEAPTGKTIVSADTSTDGQEVLATVSDDPGTSGTQYTLVEVPAGNSAFVTNGVQPGDILRINYTSDGFGGLTYEEYVIDAVLSETSLRLVAGPSAPISTPVKIEVYHTLSKSEIITEVGNKTGVFSSSRAVVVWPDYVGMAGYTVPGYYLAAAFAGLRAGSAPHRPLTNVELSGFDDLSRSVKFFTVGQLDDLAAKGVTIVAQSPDGRVYIRHAITTGDVENINVREESVRTNVDSISYQLLRTLRPFVGRVNLTIETIEAIRTSISGILNALSSATELAGIGPQVTSWEIKEIDRHPTLKDNLIVRVGIVPPYPLNVIDLYLTV